MTLLSLDNIPALQAEVRALAAERGAVILAHNYQLPEIQDVANFVGDSLALSQQAAAHRRRGDRLLRRPLHGRDGLDPLARQDRPAARPGRRLLAGRLDQRRRSCAPGRRAPRRRHGHVRQHDRRGEGGDRLLRDLLERRAGGRAHLPRARRRHRDPLRPRHVPRRLRREGHRPQDARLGRRVPRARRHPPVATSRDARAPPRRRLPDPPRVRLLDLGDRVRGRRRRRPRGRAHALHRRHAPLRAVGAVGATAIVATETGMLTRCARRGRTWTSWPPTRPRAAGS